MSDGQKGDLVVELDESLDDHATCACTASLLRVAPGRFHPGFIFDDTLAFAGARHHGFDYAGQSNLIDSCEIFIQGGSKAVRRGWQVQFFGGKASDSFPIHGEFGGHCRRNDVKALSFEAQQLIGRNRLDLRHDEMRSFA